MSLEWLTAERAAFLSAITGGPSVVYAAATDEWLPVVSGVALGVIGLGWAIYRAANDQRFETILKRLDKAEAEVDDYREQLSRVNRECIRLKAELDEVKVKHERLLKRLNAHVCPAPADPAAKCRISEVIGE
jgi:peptidoglycan hydrolase CwlO-like protein